MKIYKIYYKFMDDGVIHSFDHSVESLDKLKEFINSLKTSIPGIIIWFDEVR